MGAGVKHGGRAHLDVKGAAAERDGLLIFTANDSHGRFHPAADPAVNGRFWLSAGLGRAIAGIAIAGLVSQAVTLARNGKLGRHRLMRYNRAPPKGERPVARDRLQHDDAETSFDIVLDSDSACPAVGNGNGHADSSLGQGKRVVCTLRAPCGRPSSLFQQRRPAPSARRLAAETLSDVGRVLAPRGWLRCSPYSISSSQPQWRRNYGAVTGTGGKRS